MKHSITTYIMVMLSFFGPAFAAEEDKPNPVESRPIRILGGNSGISIAFSKPITVLIPQRKVPIEILINFRPTGLRGNPQEIGVFEIETDPVPDEKMAFAAILGFLDPGKTIPQKKRMHMAYDGGLIAQFDLPKNEPLHFVRSVTIAMPNPPAIEITITTLNEEGSMEGKINPLALLELVVPDKEWTLAWGDPVKTEVKFEEPKPPYQRIVPAVKEIVTATVVKKK